MGSYVKCYGKVMVCTGVLIWFDKGMHPDAVRKMKKGKKMAGHMGDEQVTVRSLHVVSIDEERNLLLVKGPVPGPNTGVLFIKTPTRLYKPKANAQAGKS